MIVDDNFVIFTKYINIIIIKYDSKMYYNKFHVMRVKCNSNCKPSITHTPSLNNYSYYDH